MCKKKKRVLAMAMVWCCAISMLFGNVNATAQESSATTFPFETEAAQSMIFSQLYPFAIAGTSSALFTFDTPSSNVNYQLKIFVATSASIQAEIFDENGICRVRNDFYNGSYVCFSLPKSSTYYMRISGLDGSSGQVLLTKITDDFGDSIQNAFGIGFHTEYAVTSEIANDTDYLGFMVNGDDAAYTLYMDPATGSTGTYELWNAYGQRIDAYCGSMGNSMVVLPLSLPVNQMYYLKLSSPEAGRQVIVAVQKVIRQYEVRYHLNGGTNVAGNQTVFTATQNWKLKNPVRAGYTFEGWYLTPQFTRRVYNMSGASKKSVDLYAKWNPVRVSAVSRVKVKKYKTGMQVTFSKMAQAKGYRLEVSTNAKFRGAKKYTLKSTKKYLKRNKKKTYYVRVCAYRTDSAGRKIYGSYSKAVKLAATTVKKASTKKKTTKKTTTSKKKTTTKASSKKSSSKKSSTKKKTTKTSTKKSSSKKTSTKKKTTKTSTKKSSSKKSSTKKKTTSKKKTTTKASSKKSSSKKSSMKKKTTKTSTKKSSSKKTSTKKKTAKTSTKKKTTKISSKKSSSKKTS